MKHGFGGAIALGALLISCNGDSNRVAARVACYPPCLASIVQYCPMLSACQLSGEMNMQIPNRDVRNGIATCFASGEKQWSATNATTGDSYFVVKRADGGECYTVISAPGSATYTISVGGQTIAVLAAESTTSPPTITCGGATGDIVVTPDCNWAPWADTNTLACGQGPCTFGAFPTGAATDEAN